MPARSHSFSDLFRCYHRDVLRLCTRLLGDVQAGEDAAQETFERVLKHFDAIDWTRSPWPWMSTIARRVCLDQLRSGRVTDYTEPNELPEHGQKICYEDSTCDLVVLADETMDRRARLRHAFGMLRPKDRLLLWLRLEEGWSYEAIAAALSSSVDGVRNGVWRARRQLQEMLRRYPIAAAIACWQLVRHLVRRAQGRAIQLAEAAERMAVFPEALMLTICAGLFGAGLTDARVPTTTPVTRAPAVAMTGDDARVTENARVPERRVSRTREARNETSLATPAIRGDVGSSEPRRNAALPNDTTMYVEIRDPDGNVIVSDRTDIECGREGAYRLPDQLPVRTTC